MANWKNIGTAYLQPASLPRSGGCYAVYLDRELVYIGQSSSVSKRFYCYRFGKVDFEGRFSTTPWGNNHRVVIKIRSSQKYGDWAMNELRLIKRLKPRFNKLGAL